ncbi:unnamed protein product [Ectocarpus sp. CCAP 1310/34]|nr:unnamed protein product [Ectocarpus sp. CCAP 1310/34]
MVMLSPSLRYRRRRSRFPTAVAVAAAVAAALAAPFVVAGTEPAVAAQEVVDLPELTGTRGETQDHGRVDPEPRQGPGKGPGGYDGFSAHPMIDVGEECAPSPLWVKNVNTSSYELGCEEIEALKLGQYFRIETAP